MSLIIPIFIPHVGCPHDCVFCNQKKIAGTVTPPTLYDVSSIIENALSKSGKGAEVAFYGGSFTAIESELMTGYLSAAHRFIERGDVSHIRLSTRPDCISEDILETLWSFGVRTIELGAQSMNDSVLLKAGRGHTAEDTEKSARLIKSFGFSLILQMMTNLPGSSNELDIETAKKIASLSPDGVRIYPTVVIRDTALESLWRCGKYTPQTPDEAASLGAELISIFEEKDIPIIRFGLNPTDDLSSGDALCGPYHPALGEMAQAARYLALATEKVEKENLRGGELSLFVSPKRVSAMAGLRKSNKLFLMEKYGFSSVSIRGDASLRSGEVRLSNSK